MAAREDHTAALVTQIQALATRSTRRQYGHGLPAASSQDQARQFGRLHIFVFISTAPAC